MPAPQWLEDLKEAQDARLAGAILSFNTADRLYLDQPAPWAGTLKYALAGMYHAEKYHVGYFSISEGFTELAPPGSQRQDSSPLSHLVGTENVLHLLRGLGTVLRQLDSQCVVLLDYAEHLAPSAAVGAGGNQEYLIAAEILHAWSLDDDIRQSNNFLVLITHEDALHSLIDHDSAFLHISIDLPDAARRLQFVHHLQEMRDQDKALGDLGIDLSPQQLAHATGGLRLRDIEELFLHSGASGHPLDLDQIKNKKKRTIAQLCHDLLEVVEPSEGFEAVAGCRHAIEYFQAIKPLWQRGAPSFPQGILLAGVPGSGKSFLVKALARELDCPCLVMRNVREMWVGQSERNLERVLQVARNLAPVLFWTDELDQNGGGARSSADSSGDSGVSNRMLGRLLEFFGTSENRGHILWVATTNRPDLLDVAIQDRFAVKIPFLHPTLQERAALLPVLARQVGRQVSSEVDCEALAAQPELGRLTVRALQEIIVWAATLTDLASNQSETAISAPALEQAIADYKPSFDPLEHERIALSALRMTSFTSLLPWVGLTGFRGNGEWPSYLEGMVDLKNGQIDLALLEDRLRELDI